MGALGFSGQHFVTCKTRVAAGIFLQAGSSPGLQLALLKASVKLKVKCRPDNQLADSHLSLELHWCSLCGGKALSLWRKECLSLMHTVSS